MSCGYWRAKGLLWCGWILWSTRKSLRRYRVRVFPGAFADNVHLTMEFHSNNFLPVWIANFSTSEHALQRQHTADQSTGCVHATCGYRVLGRHSWGHPSSHLQEQGCLWSGSFETGEAWGPQDSVADSHEPYSDLLARCNWKYHSFP